jgi:hypothetical protein
MLSHGASIFDVTTAWLSMMLAYPCILRRGCLVLFWGGDVMKLVEIETNNMKLAQKFLFFSCSTTPSFKGRTHGLTCVRSGLKYSDAGANI